MDHPSNPSEPGARPALWLVRHGQSTWIGPSVTGLDGGRVADPDARPAGGESVRDLYRRAAEFIDELAAAVDDDGAGDVVVVAHGGTVRVLEAYLRGIAADQMAWGPVGNTAVIAIPGFQAARPGDPRSLSGSPVSQPLLSHPPGNSFRHSQGGNR